jgi:anhydro-N-acetylmuramic acid kinase
MSRAGLYLGLMSGTSVDAIDAVLLEISGAKVRLVHGHSQPMEADLRHRVLAAARGETVDLDELCDLDRRLGEAFGATAVAALDAAAPACADLRAIGSHGQTIHHRSRRHTGTGYTLQLGDANIIAERTGAVTVADFRRADIAAGGEGAPLVPPFHAAVFGCPGEQRAILNIGGIANLTLLDGHQVVAGFDCGPGNTLLDAWIASQRGAPFDRHGAWAAEHAVDEALLAALLADPFFRLRGARSTGPEHFSLPWLHRHLDADLAPGVVQATLAELTARSIATGLEETATPPAAVFVCGGGALNTDLMRRLHRLLEPRGVRVGTTHDLGMDPQWVEGAAFAWLAARRLQDLPGNAPAVTGAAGERVLGAIYRGRRSQREQA